jgi:branched-chain amino acid transport system permease protein
MTYLAWLLIHGALMGMIYTLVAVTFVVVYKSTRAANFAVGEWVMLGAWATAAGQYLFGSFLDATVGLLIAMIPAGFAMMMGGVGVARIAAVPMRLRSPMAMIMLTLGLGAVIRGGGTILFHGIPKSITLPIPDDHVDLFGMPLPLEQLVCALIAGLGIVAVTWFHRYTRTGLALRAMAANPTAALGAGIDVARHIALSWALAGLVATVAGVLWTVVSGGGFGTMLVGLKVFPIVIIGGLSSIPGCMIGAMVIGVTESLAAGYLDPILGSGVSTPLSALLLLLVLWLRPQGLFGERPAMRV